MNFNTALILMEQDEVVSHGFTLYKAEKGLFWEKKSREGYWICTGMSYTGIKSEDWEIYEEPKELKEVEFYRSFNVEDGRLSLYCYAKEDYYIENGFLKEGNITDAYSRLTKELVHTAYIDNNNKVVKYILASGEEIVV